MYLRNSGASSEINKWAEIFNLPFELWYSHPQVEQSNSMQRNSQKFFRSLRKRRKQRRRRYDKSKECPLASALKLARGRSGVLSMPAKYEFMKVIAGPSREFRSQSISERNRALWCGRKANEMKFYWYWTWSRGCWGMGVKDEEKIEIYPAKNYYENYRTEIMIIPATVRYIQISFSGARWPARGMTFLIKLYDDDKKVLKIYFQPHKLFEKVRRKRRLLMEVILMHWVTFISHITENEYHGAEVFRSIPNCIYVLEVIGACEPAKGRDEGAEIIESDSLDSMAIQWRVKIGRDASSLPSTHTRTLEWFVVLTRLKVMNKHESCASLFIRRLAALDFHLTRDLHGKVFCVMRNKSMHEITSENFCNLFLRCCCNDSLLGGAGSSDTRIK